MSRLHRGSRGFESLATHQVVGIKDGRSVAIVLTISILFGVIMGFSFMLEGLRETILGAALQANDGKVYLDVGYQELAGFGPGRVEKVDSEAKLDEFIKEGVTRYHGKIIGEKLNYQFNNVFETITPAVAESISGVYRVYRKIK